MKKKLIALTLVFLLAFTGCSAADAKLMALQKEASALKEVSLDGTINMTMNLKAITGLVVNLLEGQSASTEDLAEVPEKAVMDLKMAGTLNQETITGSMDLTFKDRTGTYIPYASYVFKNGEVFISSDLFANAAKISSELLNLSEEQAKLTETQMNEQFASLIGDKKWISFGDMSSVMGTDIKSMNALQTTLQDKLTTFFKDLDLKLVKNNKLEVSAEDLPTIATDVYTYVNTHIDESYALVNEILKAVAPTTEEVTKEQFTEALKDIPTGIEALKTGVVDFKGSKYTDQLKKSGKKYIDTVTLDIVYQGATLLSVNGTITYEKAAIKEIPDVSSFVKFDELMPSLLGGGSANEVVLTFETGKTDATLVSVAGQEAVQVQVIDSTTYLPLRSICEALGEQVTWKSDVKKAFVNDKELSGIIKNNKTYLKVRDFEKVGYTVNYEKVGTTHMVTLTK